MYRDGVAAYWSESAICRRILGRWLGVIRPELRMFSDQIFVTGLWDVAFSKVNSRPLSEYRINYTGTFLPSVYIFSVYQYLFPTRSNSKRDAAMSDDVTIGAHGVWSLSLGMGRENRWEFMCLQARPGRSLWSHNHVGFGVSQAPKSPRFQMNNSLLQYQMI